MNAILLTDAYKTHHFKMYPENTRMIYSNFTPRKSRIEGINSVVVFGLQYFLHKYLQGKFQQNFFDKPWEEVDEEYKFAINTTTDHIKALHELGYLPLLIKALPEGTRCPIRVPCMTIRNTKPEFYWLTNYLETLISCQLWQPITSATIAAEYWKILSKYAKETTGSDDFVQWQGHDFSMRGMSSLESAILSGMGHLTSFTGTDTIPAIYAMRSSYRPSGLIGASVPATEHSVECMGGAENMLGTLRAHLKTYPTGILSKVMDTWDLTQVVKPAEDGILVQAKNDILSRDGKLVIRPDSCPKGLTPADILCGHEGHLSRREEEAYYPEFYSKGLVECLWEIFGGTEVKGGDGKMYKVLDSHIGAIYGDSISLDIAEDVCKRLKAKGFASTNIVFGIGSFTYQYNTRDTFGFAMKATFGTVHKNSLDSFDTPLEIFKDPKTDDGTKKSLKGLISVHRNVLGDLTAKDQQTWEQEAGGMLVPVYQDGKILKEYSLEEIRNRIQKGE